MLTLVGRLFLRHSNSRSESSVFTLKPLLVHASNADINTFFNDEDFRIGTNAVVLNPIFLDMVWTNRSSVN